MSTLLKRHLGGILLQAKGDYLDQVRSDQMFLGKVRLEAGPHDRQSKTLKGELEHNLGSQGS
jgi:hypothetical protein